MFNVIIFIKYITIFYFIETGVYKEIHAHIVRLDSIQNLESYPKNGKIKI